jgi:hypothetical protein
LETGILRLPAEAVVTIALERCAWSIFSGHWHWRPSPAPTSPARASRLSSSVPARGPEPLTGEAGVAGAPGLDGGTAEVETPWTTGFEDGFLRVRGGSGLAARARRADGDCVTDRLCGFFNLNRKFAALILRGCSLSMSERAVGASGAIGIELLAFKI